MESSHAAFVSFRPSYLPQNVSLDRQQPSPLSSPPQRFIQLSSKFDLPHLHSCKQILNFTSFHNPRLHHPRNHPRAFSSSFLFRSNCVCSSSSVVSLPTSSLQSTGCQIGAYIVGVPSLELSGRFFKVLCALFTCKLVNRCIWMPLYCPKVLFSGSTRTS